MTSLAPKPKTSFFIKMKKRGKKIKMKGKKRKKKLIGKKIHFVNDSQPTRGNGGG
jgi:hypothetical protein